jgi:maltose alpha-D-glucosyltransferase/alpha-amylase
MGEKSPHVRLPANSDWTEVLQGGLKTRLERGLPAFLQSRRWFGGKAREIQNVHLKQAIRVTGEAETACYLAVVKVDYFEGEAEHYLLPLAFASGERALHLLQTRPELIIADVHLRQSDTAGVLYDAIVEPALSQALLQLIVRKRRIRHDREEMHGLTSGPLARARNGHHLDLVPSVSGYEQSNSSVVFSERFIMKLLRRIEAGEHPDWEVGRFLTDVAGFTNTPPLAGAIELIRPGQEPVVLALLHEYVANQGTAWKHARDALGRFLEQHLAHTNQEYDAAATTEPGRLVEASPRPVPQEVAEWVGGYLTWSQLLGTRTAQMHQALASHPEVAEFAPEAFSQHYQRSLYQSLRKRASQALQRLRKSDLPPALAELAHQVVSHEQELFGRFQALQRMRIEADRIRCHGDYHLGQVLFTGKDYMIMDFEGEPARSLSERRIKRSPLLDVAGMIRSLHYVSNAAVLHYLQSQAAGTHDEAWLRDAASRWYSWMSRAFLETYLIAADGASFIPRTREQIDTLLSLLLLEKALYELNYELNNRPEWVEVPLRGIHELLTGK